MSVMVARYMPLGKYDIVVDVNSDGKYDAGVDALGSNEIRISAGLSS